MSKRTVLYVLLAGLFLVASAYQVRFIQRRLAYLSNPETFVRNQISTSVSGEINFLSQTAKDAGIRESDLLLEVEGRPYTGRGVISDALVGKRMGDPITVRIRRSEAGAPEDRLITFPIGLLAVNEEGF